MTTRVRAAPGAGATVAIAALSTLVGLALSSAVLTTPVQLDGNRRAVIAVVVACQALLWWWLRRRAHGVLAALVRLARERPALALWSGVELVGLGLLWFGWTPGGSRAMPVWSWVGGYFSARAALTALGIAGQVAGRSGAGSGSSRTRAVRLVLLGAALAAPAALPLSGARPTWLNAVAGGWLTLGALAAAARDGAARDTWLGLAAVLASPALALGGSALLVGAPTLPLAAPIALTALAPALGLAGLACPAVLGAGRLSSEPD